MITQKPAQAPLTNEPSLGHSRSSMRSIPSSTPENNIKTKANDAAAAALASEPIIQIARTSAQKKKAYHLAYKAYVKKGFLSRNNTQQLISSHDDDPRTLVLLALDLHQKAIATMSLFYDTPEGLPSDQAFGAELDALRKQGRKPVEISRLVLADATPRFRVLLARMFNLIYIQAYRIEEQTDILIEVHPRHIPFYRQMFGFKPCGPIRPCPYVRNSPAQLMTVQLQQIAGWINGINAPRRSLYSHFMDIDMEHHLFSSLKLRQH